METDEEVALIATNRAGGYPMGRNLNQPAETKACKAVRAHQILPCPFKGLDDEQP